MKLTGVNRYTITLPDDQGTVTYVKGETVPTVHSRHIPEADRSLFIIAAPTASAASKTTRKSRSTKTTAAASTTPNA